MNPAPFTYHRANSVGDAIALLQRHNDEGAKLIAGGHSLLPVMKLRLAEPAHLIDLGGATDAGLRDITRNGDTLTIGAMVTHRQLERDATLAEACPLLVEQAKVVGDRQVRARGTIGGTLAHADPAADYPAGMLALDATVVALGPNGERSIPISEFFLGLLTTALAPDEIITRIEIPVAAGSSGANYQKLANQASGYAVVGVAAVVALNDDGTVGVVKIGVTGAGAQAVRATAVELALVGKTLDEATVKAAANQAADGIAPLEDMHASASYRRRVTRGLTARAVLAAHQEALSR